MAEKRNWAFPAALQPSPADVDFDLQRALDAVVSVRTEVPEDAFTASILGTERLGNGVVIRGDGLVLTIGYLITEATSVWLTTGRGTVVGGYPLAYDQATGFGLVQPLGALGVAALPRGSVTSCAVGDDVILAGHGGRKHALKTQVFAKREFAGYWEYMLDEALFTAPAHPQWGGAALIGDDGKLLGIGSLLVQEQLEGRSMQGNMIVPIDILEPILEDLLTRGRANLPPRPWLGIYTAELGQQIAVAGLAEGGPAERAEVQSGDVLLEVAGQKVTGLADFYRKLWCIGPAGSVVPLTLSREGSVSQVSVRSADRQDFLRKPRLH
jgi:S1-C subfamily serine protease